MAAAKEEEEEEDDDEREAGRRRRFLTDLCGRGEGALHGGSEGGREGPRGRPLLLTLLWSVGAVAAGGAPAALKAPWRLACCRLPCRLLGGDCVLCVDVLSKQSA